MKNSPTPQSLTSCYEVEIHYKRPLFDSMPIISKAEDAETLLREFINLQQIDLRECFWVLLLTRSNHVLGISEVGSGSTGGVLINLKYIFQLAILSNASAIILAHNHPSGSLTISEADIKETKKIKRLAKTLEIEVHDHIIISSESFVSLVEEGDL